MNSESLRPSREVETNVDFGVYLSPETLPEFVKYLEKTVSQAGERGKNVYVRVVEENPAR
jgi:hypothetical protein